MNNTMYMCVQESIKKKTKINYKNLHKQIRVKSKTQHETRMHARYFDVSRQRRAVE